MDWLAEANAVIKDIRPFVNSIEISNKQKSSDMRIYFTIVTLEGQHLEVMMDSNGFSICQEKIYETIYALLDDNSVKYREAFAQALSTRVSSLEEASD